MRDKRALYFTSKAQSSVPNLRKLSAMAYRSFSFPYAAQTEPSLPSVLQVAIDHGFKQGDVLMILCGSCEGFMES